MTKSDVTYAVIRVGGQQFKVSAGDTILVDRVDAEEGKSVTYDTLAVRTDSGTFDGDALAFFSVNAIDHDTIAGAHLELLSTGADDRVRDIGLRHFNSPQDNGR